MNESLRRRLCPAPHELLTSPVWRMDEDANKGARRDSYIAKGFGTLNQAEFKKAIYIDIGGLENNDFIPVPNPETVCRPKVKFPSDGFAPDFFDFFFTRYCSARLREAFAQPPEVIQYLDVDMICDGAAALAQDYKVMRILAHQPALDLQHSEYDFSFWPKLGTDTLFLHLGTFKRPILLEDFKPKTEIFRVEERPTRFLVTDALAERVLKAKCTGLEFIHPAYPDYSGGRPYVIRTAKGSKIVDG